MVEIYKDKILPNQSIHTVSRAEKVINPLEPLRDTAVVLGHLDEQYNRIKAENERIKQNQLGHLDEQYNRIKAENERIKQNQFESDLKLKQAEFNSNLEKITNAQDFDKAIQKYNSDIDNLGNTVMGEDAYKKWSNEKGRNYKELANIGYKSIWVKNLQKQNYDRMQDVVSNYATLASMSDKDRDTYIQQANIAIAGQELTEQQKMALTNRFKVELANAEVVRDINANPQNALDKLKEVYKDKTDNNDRPAYYDGLTPVQRQRYIEQAQRQYDAELNTYQDKKINNLKQQFNELYQDKGYEAAFKFRKHCIENLDDIIKQENITQEQFQAFRSYSNAMLRDPNSEYAQANQEKYGNLQVAFKKMGIKSDKKGNYVVDTKQQRYVEDIVDLINNIDEGLENGSYYVNQNNVIKMRSALRVALGDMVNNGVRLRDTDVEGSTFISGIWRGQGLGGDITASEYIADSILKVLQNKNNIKNFNIDKISVMEKGEVFEHVYRTAMAGGIDLKSHYIKDKENIDKITQSIFNRLINSKFNVPQKNYSAVVGDGNIYDTNNPNAQNNIGKKTNGYGQYAIDKNGALRLVDENGNIVDEVK